MVHLPPAHHHDHSAPGSRRSAAPEHDVERRQREHWRRNLGLTGVLLAIWFVVTFVVIWYARELNEIVIAGFPLAFYMGAQGALIVYLLLVRFYARRMNELDERYGVNEAER